MQTIPGFRDGLLVAGEVDGGPPDFPRAKNEIRTIRPLYKSLLTQFPVSITVVRRSPISITSPRVSPI
jgi:hypothetical protein